MQEIETRIIKINVEKIRKKMNDINAVKVKQENQVNNLYDFENNILLNKKGYARIRIIEDLLNNTTEYYMTTKKMISQEKYKIMEEHEIEISDCIEGDKLFKSLGLKLIGSIKKYRESYKYKNTLIEIDINDKDFCPFPYIELEGFNEHEIEEIVSLLGYTMEDTTSKTIYDIMNEEKEGLIKGV